jgi:hypothetical protein
VWNIAGGSLPADATVPGFYLVSGSATIGDESYAPGDMLVWGDEGEWHRIDNQQTVASVAGLVGTISIADLQTALNLGTAAYQATTAFATAAQGTKADSAVQPSDLLADAMTVIDNGSDADYARPSGAAAVYWTGSAEPSNAAEGDFWWAP